MTTVQLQQEVITQAPQQELAVRNLEPEPEALGKEDPEAIARREAIEHNQDVELFVEVVRRESDGWQNIQSLVPSDGPNGREDSWGICQIHLPSNPSITKEQALDPAFCLDWMAKEWEAGRAWKWTEWRKLTGNL